MTATLWVVVLVGGAAYAASLAVPLWFQVHEQRLLIVTSGSMAPMFEAGDAVVLRRITDPSQLKVGQVVSFWPVGSQSLVTHRVVELHMLPQLEADPLDPTRSVPLLDDAGDVVENPYIVTKGDANPLRDPNATPLTRVRGSSWPSTRVGMGAAVGRVGPGPGHDARAAVAGAGHAGDHGGGRCAPPPSYGAGPRRGGEPVR
ncbi:signal peptidase I [Cellulomonas soli]